MTGFFLCRLYAYIAILSCIGAFAASSPGNADNSRPPARAAYEPRFVPNPDSGAPPYFRGRVFFSPDSVALLADGVRMLRHTARWLREHPNARILIVGLCDPTGSEACHRSLAQARGKVVRRFLVSQGVPESQIEGVLGWERAAEPCRAPAETCQRLNRTTRVFVASAIASGKEEDGDSR